MATSNGQAGLEPDGQTLTRERKCHSNGGGKRPFVEVINFAQMRKFGVLLIDTRLIIALIWIDIANTDTKLKKR